MTQYIMSITARDRSGIVAGVSESLVQMNGNIEAASQTVHRGYFAMILLVTLPESADPQVLSETVRKAAGNALHVYVTEFVPSPQAMSDSRKFIFTSVGPDRPGILNAVANCFASRQINIDDLYCFVENGDFIIICAVSLPAEMDVHMVQDDLETLGQSLGFTASLQHENIFTATNDLAFGLVK